MRGNGLEHDQKRYFQFFSQISEPLEESLDRTCWGQSPRKPTNFGMFLFLTLFLHLSLLEIW